MGKTTNNTDTAAKSRANDTCCSSARIQATAPTPATPTSRNDNDKRTSRNDNDKSSTSNTTETERKMADQIHSAVVEGLRSHADEKTRAWFSNYVKTPEGGPTVWFGCKVPVTRAVVKDVLEEQFNEMSPNQKKRKRGKTDKDEQQVPSQTDSSADLLFESAVLLMKREECDAKLAGMLLLSEHYPVDRLATLSTLRRLEKDILEAGYANDWSSADWFSNKVLQRIVYHSSGSDDLVQAVLDFTKRHDSNLWHRRCGVVPFVTYHNDKHRKILPSDIGRRIVQACERSLLISPEERFTQTGIAWVLRYVLWKETDPKAKQECYDMILRHGGLWTVEAKKSMTEKLSASDKRKKKILALVASDNRKDED